MITALFYVPIFSYEVNEWERKKESLLSKINRNKFEYYELNNLQTDRHSNKNRYAIDFHNIFDEELNLFKLESNVKHIRITDIWTLKHTNISENHCPHNHRSTGYSGVLYLEYDSSVHEPTKFIGPWNDPLKDTTQLSEIPDPKPGVIYIWPSAMIHYVDAMKTNKLRMVTSFDMEVK